MSHRRRDGSFLPSHYADTEGGLVHEWDGDWVSERDLCQRDRRAVSINGRKVHALLFSDEPDILRVWESPFGAWDCINGWRHKLPYDSREWTGR